MVSLIFGIIFDEVIVNFSKCQNGSWLCTKKVCPGVCAAWGEGHYKTFDGKMFDFTGNCEYVLAKGFLSDTDSFAVHVKNVPCGTSSVTCSKAATIKVGSGAATEVVKIVRGEEATLGPNHKRYVNILTFFYSIQLSS